jgi:hypothetical protein
MRIRVKARKGLNMAKFIGAIVGVMPEMIRVTPYRRGYLSCRVPYINEEQLTDIKLELKKAGIKFISAE